MPPTRPRSLVLTGTLLLALAAATLVPAGRAAAAPGPERLQIEQAWIRWLPANLPAGGYLTVANRGDRPVVLVGATSPDYTGVDLHRSMSEGGLSTMVPVKQIIVAAHSRLSFSATGYHIMLMRPTRPVKPGDRVPITLHFADGRSLVVNFEVRPPGAAAPAPAMAMPGMRAAPAQPH